jgi:proteasome lid subunit RPN8/RPN11
MRGAVILMESADWRPAISYHSHPRGPETLSPTDIAHTIYPESVYLIGNTAKVTTKRFDRLSRLCRERVGPLILVTA